MALTRLLLSNFRNHAQLALMPEKRFLMLHGPNGAGKTNILEAISLLVPGRGLRRAALSDMALKDGDGSFAVSANLSDIQLGTGTEAGAPERRKVRINGAIQSINSLAEWLAVIWLTPSMDRIFTEGAGGRRRFLDRLVLASAPRHAAISGRYDQATRQRNRLLSGDTPADAMWLDAIETEMASAAADIDAARHEMVAALSVKLAEVQEQIFAVPQISLDDQARPSADEWRARWRASRGRDAAAGRTLEGPHRVDLRVVHAGKNCDAASCSTGEQKAMLLSMILAHAELIAEKRGEPPVLLLDEVAAHLDPQRRAALFERLDHIGGQVWMTGTEEALFSGVRSDLGQMIAVGEPMLAPAV